MLFHRLAIAGGMAWLALWYGGTLWATDQGIRNVEARVETAPAISNDAKPWQALRFFGDPDAYHWLSFARDLRASGRFRIRHTGADNAPFGRDVHWAQLPIWSLAAISVVLERAAGLSPPIALEWAGRLLMPLAGFLFCSAILLLLARWTHPFIGLVAATSIAVSSLYDFHALRPDHHGFQIAFAVGSLLCLLCSGMGWYRLPSRGPSEGHGLIPLLSAARRRFIASGLLGGMALWLGATVFAFVWFAIAAGTAIAILFSSPPGERNDIRLHPDLFRWWGLAGAGSALFYYLLEYAPSHLSMRLEVNHPLYALCFLGTAECLRALACWKQDRAAFRRSDFLSAMGGLLAAATLPVLVLFGPVAWYIPRSPLMLRLHSRFIVDFLPPWQAAGFPAYLEHAPLLLLGAASLGATGILLRRKSIPFPYQAPLILLAAVSLWLGLLYHWQCRWFQFLAPVYILFAVGCLATLCESRSRDPAARRRPPWLILGLAGLLLAQSGHAAHRDLRPIGQMLRVEHMDGHWLQYMLQRNLILQLKAVAHGERFRMILPVDMAPAVHYFGLGDAVPSLYWENLEGLAAAAEFFGDPLPGSRARDVFRKRGITHLLLNRELREPLMFYDLLGGQTDRTGFSACVGGALSEPDEDRIPDWLRPEDRLSRMAGRVYYIHVPAQSRWVPFSLPIRIYALRTDFRPLPPTAPDAR